MFRRRLSLAVSAVACLLIASAAAADPSHTFTATAAPSHVKPATSSSYTITLTNDSTSADRAQRAADRDSVGLHRRPAECPGHDDGGPGAPATHPAGRPTAC